MAAVRRVVTTGTGEAANWLTLPPGLHTLDMTWAGSAGDATLVSRITGSGVFIDAEDSAGVIQFTANKSVAVLGGRDYTVDVTTHTSVLTVASAFAE